MNSKHAIGYEPSVEAQAIEQDADGFEVVDEIAERERNLRPTVELEIQGKVDTNHLDTGRTGLTLAAEERMEAREWEIERTRRRWDRRADSDRGMRCRCEVRRVGREKRQEFQRRAASVYQWLDPERADPRELLGREELAAVNREARRIAERLDGWSRAAISRRLAEQVAEGADVTSAVLDVFEELRTAPGQVIPIEAVGEVRRREVSIAGTVTQLWKPSSPVIQQVGLIEDKTGRIKFTAWKASDVGMVREGERVRIRSAAENWYNGRVSIALTARSRVVPIS